MGEILKRIHLVCVAIACVSVVGCAAPYQEDSLVRELLLVNSGGYRTTQISDSRFKVEYSASPVTPDDTIVKYVRYRCSSLALEKGFDGYSYEVPISVSPLRPQTKKHFYAEVILWKRPYPEGVQIVDASATRDELEAFVRSR